MTSPIGGAGSTQATTPNQSSGQSALSSLGGDAFLKLLVAQLKYQDPSNPTDSTAFMAQTAQLTQVDKLNSIAQQQTQLVASQLSAQAAALVGREVTYTTASGDRASGIVSSTTFGSAPTLRVGATDVPLSSITGTSAQA
ncbi:MULTISPECIES: flagellar hook assembly protein FlgD [Actinosynnema]|uniref:flagellar hook assembly protein FlgD n=1 Tax=Actinosynnema TaxID=40566 RepID=UPI0020A2D6A4|nr:flagellar hook capping FlgD N-terminal domain-containing protein [Actinosynnema pretiosum]MCP2099522.1 flagellar basal-body rod modification protein FlgD [Actinosynnema pretiosum]